MEEHYGPEDIEQLLLDKEFSDLLPEEKTYVLKHIEGETEYDHMRELLLGIASSNKDLVPPPALREVLITAHERHYKRPSFKVWLNSLITSLSFDTKWPRPALQLAGIAAMIIASVWILTEVRRDISDTRIVQGPEAIDTPITREESKGLGEDGTAQKKYIEEADTVEQEDSKKSSENEVSQNVENNYKETTSSFGPGANAADKDMDYEDEIILSEQESPDIAQFNAEQILDEDLEKKSSDFSISGAQVLEGIAEQPSMVSEVSEEVASSRATKNKIIPTLDSMAEEEIDIQQNPVDPEVLVLLYTAW
ncbi:MAG: hypothetical protein HKN45_04470 [Flavobacteriales bacterium]|nr:hypothetical protein [Flavobacteriales bacterium]